MSKEPVNKSLYKYVKRLADKKFLSKTGVYKSSWIVREYKRRGGKYSGKRPSYKSSGLRRWYKERWIDLNRPIRNSKGKIVGYKSCGRKSAKLRSKGSYPLCRPSKKVTLRTPKTVKSLSKRSIIRAKRQKSKLKHRGNVQFGGKYSRFEMIRKHTKSCKDSKCEQLYDIECKLCDEKKCKQSRDMLECEQLGGSQSQYYGRRSSVTVKVPEGVKRTALYAFKLKKMGFRGGKETGWKRAKQLATKDEIPIEDLKYMRAWFARHLYTSYPTYKKWIKAGRPKDSSWHNKRGIIAWLIWSGDAAFKWVNSQKNINLLNKHYNKGYKSMILK